MKVFEKILNYIDDKALEIHFVNNKLYINNYVEIKDFNSKNITINHIKGSINVIGKNLIITKLLKEELLICGEIMNIEIR